MTYDPSLFARINALETEVIDLRRVLTKAQEIFATSRDSYYAMKIVEKMIEEKLRLTNTTAQEPLTSS